MATVGLSLDTFCRGLLSQLRDAEGYEAIALSSPDASLSELGQREGVRTIGVAMHRDIAPLSDIVSLCRLISVFRRERPAMVHSMTPKAGLLGMLAARIAGVPVRVHTFTGLLFPTSKGLKRQLLMLTDRITCASSTHIIAEGMGVKADLLNHGITSRPVRVLGYGNVRGVDLNHYSPTPRLKAEGQALRRRLGIPDEARVLVFIGRFVGDKGLRELAEAMRIVSTESIHLIMVGDTEGGSDDLTAGELKALTDNPNIHISGGWVGDVRPWLTAAEALVFPSYREGFPNVVLEAGAMHLPSIVTDINGSREIITDRQNGLIVPPADSAALARAIIRLTSLPQEQLRDMGRNARANVEAKYSQSFVRGCLMDFYREILPEC